MVDLTSRGIGGPITSQLVDLTPHLPVLPIVLPLAVAGFMLLLEERRRIFKAGLGAATMAALVLASFVLLNAVAGEADGVIVYRLGDWPAPFGIVLVVDRLAARSSRATSSTSTCSSRYCWPVPTGCCSTAPGAPGSRPGCSTSP